MPKKKVFVTGCIDLLHSGHVRFLEEAAGLGEVHVGIGSDRTVKELKGRYPVTTQNERSGMASSSRRRAIELWQRDLPGGDREKTARMLFSYENPPGTREFSGSQDAIGIVYPGLNRLDYRGEYWPSQITTVDDEEILRWIEERLHLVTLGPRKSDFRVRKDTRITPARVRALAAAADGCWRAILARDEKELGRLVRASFEAQISMFPRMMDSNVRTAIKQYSGKSPGWKLSGAGGGGYLVLVGQRAIPGAIQLKIRRPDV